MDSRRRNLLAQFKAEHEPDASARVAAFRDEIVDLYLSGYSLRTTYTFLNSIGLTASFSTFARWVKKNIDFEACRNAGTQLVPAQHQAAVVQEEKPATSKVDATPKATVQANPILDVGKSSSTAETIRRRIEKGFAMAPDEVAREVTKKYR